MTQRTTRSIRFTTVLATVGALTLGACGSDGDSGGSSEAFCDSLLAINEASDDISDDDGLALLRTAADDAPSEISQQMEEFVDLFEELLSFDQENATEEQITEFTERAENFDETSADIEAFATENCPNLPDDFFD